MSFVHPLYLLLILLAVPLLWLKRKRQASLGHSRIDLHDNLHSIAVMGWITSAVFVLAWTALCLALARPQRARVDDKRSIQSRDFIIATDISGSMWSTLPEADQELLNNHPPPGTDPGQSQQWRRIDMAQWAIQLFVQRRQGDRVALLVFDDQTYYHWPLTDDLKIILRKVQLLNQREGGGTNFEGPTDDNPGMGPLQAAINHFKDFGQSKTEVLIMVTDGEDSISETRFRQLSDQMRAMGIHVYVLGVGESWAGDKDEEPILGYFAEQLGGQVMQANNPAQMEQGFDAIDRLEKSKVELTSSTTYQDVFYWFLGLSILLWMVYLGLAALTHENA